MGSCCDSCGSCSICRAEMDFTENNGDCFQATTWHNARDGSDHDGEAHAGSIGNNVNIRADWTSSNSFSVSEDGPISKVLVSGTFVGESIVTVRSGALHAGKPLAVRVGEGP